MAGDSFQGYGDLILQPGTSAVPYVFVFAACSDNTTNDGSLPFGTTISSVAVKAFDEAGTDRTAEIVNSATSTATTVRVGLNYPSTTGAGRYSLEILVTLSTGAVMEFDFTRVYAKDVAA